MSQFHGDMTTLARRRRVDADRQLALLRRRHHVGRVLDRRLREAASGNHDCGRDRHDSEQAGSVSIQILCRDILSPRIFHVSYRDGPDPRESLAPDNSMPGSATTIDVDWR